MTKQKTKYMFICSYGQNRSPTAARLAKALAKERGLDIKMDYMALFPEESEQGNELDRKRLESSNRIFVMTKDMIDIIKKRYDNLDKDFVVLGIKDEYNCHGLAGPKMTEMLEAILEKKLKRYI